jgi:predicted nucleic acid-binding protein
MFLDTNVVILFLKKDLEQKVFHFVGGLIEKEEAFISGIVMSEVLAYQGYTSSQAKKVEVFLESNFIIYDTPKEVLLLASLIARKRKQKTGKKLKLTDAIIAATSIVNKKELFTFDQEDFKEIEKLKLFKI